MAMPDRRVAMPGQSPLGALRRHRSMLAVLAGATALALVTVALVVAVAPAPRRVSTAPPPLAHGTLLDVDHLTANGLLGRIGTQPYDALIEDARSLARRALQRDPRPGPLPEAVGDLRDDGRAVLALAIASVLEGDPRHLRGTATYLDAWATGAELDPACTHTACDRLWRVARDLPAFIFAADLIRGSSVLTTEEADRFAAWLADIRPDPPRSNDMRGDAVVLARMAVSAYLEDEDGLDAAADEWRGRLDLLRADGRLTLDPDEPAPIAATQEALTYRLLAARIAAYNGRDLLGARGATGASIREGVEHLAINWGDPRAWPGAVDVSRPPAGPLWEIAYARWPDRRFLPMREEYRASTGGDLVALRWSALFEPAVTTATASAGPTVGGVAATPSPTADVSPVATPVPTASPTPVATPRPSAGSTPRPGPRVESPTIAFLRGQTRVDRALVRLSWPSGVRADGDRSALTYRLDTAVDDGRYREAAEGPRRRAELSLVPGHRHRFRVRASTEAAGPGPWNDDLAVRLRRYQDRDRAVRLAGSWASASSAAYSDGRVRYSTQRGATLTVRFHGRAVAVRAPIGPTRGEADVIVDGATVGRIDLGAQDFIGSVVVFQRAWAADGDHSIRLRVVGTPGRPVVALDAVDVLVGVD